MLINHDVVYFDQYEDKVELHCNRYLFSFESLEYYNINEPFKAIQKKLDSDTIVVDGLLEGEYRFYCVNEFGEQSRSIKVNVFNDSTRSMWTTILGDEIGEKENKIIDVSLNTKLNENYLINLYLLYLENKTEDLKEIYEKMINSYIEYKNALNNQINGQDDLYVRINKKHILEILLDKEEPYFESGIGVEIFEFVDNDFVQFDLFNVKTFEIKRRLTRNLYKIYLYKDGFIFRCFYYFSEGEEYDNNKFLDIITNNEKIDNIRHKNSIILASEYNSMSDDEKLVISGLEHANDGLLPLFNRPDILVEDDIINIVISDELHGFMKCNDSKYYLCAQTEDGIYDLKIKPKKIPVKSKEFKILIGKDAIFYHERYYFWVSDEKDNRLTNIHVYDFFRNIESYDSLYDDIMIKQFGKKLNSVISEHQPEYWSTIKSVLDSFVGGDNLKDMSFKEYFVRNIPNASPRLIYLVWLCYYKFYAKKDRNYLKKQVYKDRYNEHVFTEEYGYEKEPYILKIETIKDGEIKTKFSNELSVKIPYNCTVIYTPIRKKDMACADFVMYSDKTGRRQSWFNMLEVEEVYGL